MPVEVEVTRFVPIPSDLTRQQPVTTIPDGLTFGEAIALWAEDRAALSKANTSLTAIRSLDVME